MGGTWQCANHPVVAADPLRVPSRALIGGHWLGDPPFSKDHGQLPDDPDHGELERGDATDGRHRGEWASGDTSPQPGDKESRRSAVRAVTSDVQSPKHEGPRVRAFVLRL